MLIISVALYVKHLYSKVSNSKPRPEVSIEPLRILKKTLNLSLVTQSPREKALHKKLNFSLRTSIANMTKFADLVRFTEEIVIGRLHFVRIEVRRIYFQRLLWEN